MKNAWIFILTPLLLVGQAGAGDLMARIEGGVLRPFYRPAVQATEVAVKTFWLDRRPVTNQEFLEFVKENPKWRRDRAPRLFADSQYLSHWKEPLNLGKKADPEQPVVQVSWFAAKAYCETQAKRLPTEFEWEYAASATETAPQDPENKVWKQRLLDWYSRPTPPVLGKVGKSPANYYGVRDLHGLVWEWVLDFNSIMISGDSREGSGADKNKFCGSSGLSAQVKEDYAGFMRMAFLNSLRANYTTGNLGFRCAGDESPSL